jgi:hypothetical protein
MFSFMQNEEFITLIMASSDFFELFSLLMPKSKMESDNYFAKKIYMLFSSIV